MGAPWAGAQGASEAAVFSILPELATQRDGPRRPGESEILFERCSNLSTLERLERFSKRISVMRWERRGLESRPPVGTIATSFTYLQWPGNTQCNAQTVAKSRLLPREANIHRATEGVVADFLNLAGSEQFTSIFLQPFEPCLRADLVRTLRQHLPVGQLDIKIGEIHGAICKA